MISDRCKAAVRRCVVVVLAPLVLAGATTGCGGKKAVYPVHGVVLDGKKKPAKGTVVVFHPVNGAADKPVGAVDDKGEFVLTTYENGDGAPAGDYVVTITRPAVKRTPLDRDGGDILRGRYSDPTTSKINFTVQKGADNEVPKIQLPN